MTAVIRLEDFELNVCLLRRPLNYSAYIVEAVLTNNIFLDAVTLVELIFVIAFYDLMNQNALKKITTKETPYYGQSNH